MEALTPINVARPLGLVREHLIRPTDEHELRHSTLDSQAINSENKCTVAVMPPCYRQDRTMKGSELSGKATTL